MITDSLTDGERTLVPNEIDIDPDDLSETLPIRLTVTQDLATPKPSRFVAGSRSAITIASPQASNLLAFGWRFLSATRSTSASALEGPKSALQTLLRVYGTIVSET